MQPFVLLSARGRSGYVVGHICSSIYLDLFESILLVVTISMMAEYLAPQRTYMIHLKNSDGLVCQLEVKLCIAANIVGVSGRVEESAQVRNDALQRAYLCIGAGGVWRISTSDAWYENLRCL
jgi:hypothetical protein